MAAVADAVLALVAAGPLDVSCVQSATATSTSEGFDAAAVTVLALMTGLPLKPPPARKIHHVSLRFDHPSSTSSASS